MAPVKCQAACDFAASDASVGVAVVVEVPATAASFDPSVLAENDVIAERSDVEEPGAEEFLTAWKWIGRRPCGAWSK